MYNTQYLTRYNLSDVFLETDIVNETEKEIIRNVLYKEDLLNIFGIQEFNEEIINNSLTILYHVLKTNTRLLNCMKKLAGRIISENAELGLVFLYSFDYMERTHMCVCEFLETGNISEKNIELLENII